jgi:cellobiose-specific phosphotransferase system component IIB
MNLPRDGIVEFAGGVAELRNGKLRFVKIEKRSEPKRKEATMLPTMVEKVQRAAEMGTILQQTIEAYAAKHKVSKAVAADIVLLSPTTNEYVRLDKALTAIEHDVRMDKLQGSWTDTNPATRQSQAPVPPVAHPSDNVATHDAAQLLAQIESGQIPFTDPRVTALVQAEKARKFGAGY